MSSLIRRIERQRAPSHKVHPSKRRNLKGKLVRCFVEHPPREVFYMGRGQKLGVHNPKDKALLARLKREKRNEARRANA